MIDSDTDEFSQHVSCTIVPYVEQQPVAGIEVYFLRQLANPFRVAWTLIKLGYEPLAPVQFSSPLVLFGLSSPIYVYPNFFKYTYHLMKTIGVWNVLSTGLFANATHDFIVEIFRAAFRRRTNIWMRTENNFHNKKQIVIHTTTNQQTNKEFQTERLLEESRLSVFFERFTEILSLKLWEVLVSHPFYGMFYFILYTSISFAYPISVEQSTISTLMCTYVCMYHLIVILFRDPLVMGTN